jgi:thiol-disulfide isomerase/thioredoxin
MTTTAELQTMISENQAIMLYFYNDNCAPCKVLVPKIQQMVQDDFPSLKVHLINTEFEPVASARYDIFASPTLLVFFEGKEYIRESKNISISELHDKTERFYSMIY